MGREENGGELLKRSVSTRLQPPGGRERRRLEGVGELFETGQVKLGKAVRTR